MNAHHRALRALCAFFALIALPLTFIAQNALSPTGSGTKWDYSGKLGPAYWAKLDPAYKACSAGKLQSPIDIRKAKLNKTLKPIEFHYIAGPMTLVNNGHTVQVNVAPGSYMIANGTRYDLVQFDFHHPSEETVKGKLSDMVVHLVHKDAAGNLAVIAVRLNEGTPNAVLASLWEHLPVTKGATDKTSEEINPAGLLPVDRGYWTFDGSLTTPPCTEGVKWFVFEQEKELSREQLRAFAALYKFNARPLQNPHGRKVEASE
jgi:carbonic anhydrase